MNWFAGQKLIHVQRTNVWTPKGESDGSGAVMNWEMGIDICTLCLKWITNKNLLYKKINKIKFNKNKIKYFKNTEWDVFFCS